MFLDYEFKNLYVVCVRTKKVGFYQKDKILYQELLIFNYFKIAQKIHRKQGECIISN